MRSRTEGLLRSAAGNWLGAEHIAAFCSASAAVFELDEGKLSDRLSDMSELSESVPDNGCEITRRENEWIKFSMINQNTQVEAELIPL